MGRLRIFVGQAQGPTYLIKEFSPRSIPLSASRVVHLVVLRPKWQGSQAERGLVRNLV
jgi:hypothetical protein